MTRLHVPLLLVATAALSLAPAAVYAKGPSTADPKPSAVQSYSTHSSVHGGKQTLLSDTQLDKVAAGLGFDYAGYRAALNVWLAGVQSVLATYTGVEAHLPLLTGCSGSGLSGGVCTAGTPPPDPLPFFK